MRYCDGIGHIYCICCLANGKLYIEMSEAKRRNRYEILV